MSTEDSCSAAIDPVDHARDLQGRFDRVRVTGAAGQAPGPVDDGAAAPCIGRRREHRALRADIALGAEVVERAVHVAHYRAGLVAVEMRNVNGSYYDFSAERNVGTQR